ncbi:transglycosylase SLT domain-containing protein [Ktedonobacter racemifer]|uniref:Transglycosylase SLT domain-containing protein n=1 Tax=Ktedonobacter racemifer DSM 44963 TaxID=485913 RepID=D6TLB2_KTERA|nr:transglycosylase SLT domain-containing protein [Ktedonobacter racemifer]EFH86562.1 hypothetical protein Krac_7864 [Ktedonobacter racemifer DSM 44963]
MKEHTIQTSKQPKKMKSLLLKLGMATLFGVMMMTAMLGLGARTASAKVHTANANADVVSMIRQVFGPHANQAINIARCESHFNPNATNTQPIGNSHAAGVFQILYPSTWNGTPMAGSSPYDAYANIKAAYHIFQRDGYSWYEWQCQP